MGIFADTCHALVDPETGKALTGEALKEARANSKHPRCGNKVKKSARFCNKCGSPAPKGWWRCHSCGKWVGNDSEHCWNCGAALHPERRPDLNGGVWSHQPGIVAQRFEVGDIQRLLRNGLQIGEGTAAYLLESGRFVDVLDPGRHNLDSLARKINHWGSPPPRTVVLVESGEIILPIRMEGLRSAEEMEVRYYGELIVALEPDQAQPFLANLFKQKDRLTFEELSDLLTGEIRHAVENFCNTSTIDDLVKDPERRLRLEAILAETLERATAGWGIGIRRVSSAEFYGKAYEEIRAKAGEAETLRRHYEFDQKIRELTTKEKMSGFKSEADLDAYVASLAHERGVTAEHCNHELSRLRLVHRHELEGMELARQMEEEAVRAKQKIELLRDEDSYSREKLVEDTKAEVEAGRVALELRREKEALKRENLTETARILDGKDINTLISLVEDPERRRSLLEVYNKEAMRGRPPEEILALSAAESPELARALVEIMATRRQDKESSLEDLRRLNQEQAAQLERILGKAFATASDAAKSGGTTTNINR